MKALLAFLQSLRPQRPPQPSSRSLWYAERRWHHAYCRALWSNDDAAGWHALREMARCRDELDRRGVTHL